MHAGPSYSDCEIIGVVLVSLPHTVAHNQCCMWNFITIPYSGLILRGETFVDWIVKTFRRVSTISPDKFHYLKIFMAKISRIEQNPWIPQNFHPSKKLTHYEFNGWQLTIVRMTVRTILITTIMYTYIYTNRSNYNSYKDFITFVVYAVGTTKFLNHF